MKATLLPARRFRIVRGDPPVDWEREDLGGFVHTQSEKVKSPTNDERYNRESHAIDVLRREVLAKGRRAFVIYGGHRMMRGQDNLVQKLEQRCRIKTFVIARADRARP